MNLLDPSVCTSTEKVHPSASSLRSFIPWHVPMFQTKGARQNDKLSRLAVSDSLSNSSFFHPKEGMLSAYHFFCTDASLQHVRVATRSIDVSADYSKIKNKDEHLEITRWASSRSQVSYDTHFYNDDGYHCILIQCPAIWRHHPGIMKALFCTLFCSLFDLFGDLMVLSY